MLHNRTNKEILAELDRVVYGHTAVKKALISLINRSKLRHFQKWLLLEDRENWVEIGKLLILGGSGTGKTHLVETIARLVRFPLVKVDATSFNPTGADGGLKAADLCKLIRKSAREHSLDKSGYWHSEEGTTDQMIVFVDEIDKLGTSFGSSGSWNQHVQSNFLTLFDNKDEFEGVSFIFAGAFTKLNKENDSKSSIGFTQSEDAESECDLASELVKVGLIPELVGRFSNIVELDRFDIDDYYKVLNELILPKKLSQLKAFNIPEPTFTDVELKKIAKKAHSSGQGIRALARELDKLFHELEFNYEDYLPETPLLKWEGF